MSKSLTTITSPKEIKKILFVVNPIAGGNDQSNFHQVLDEHIKNSFEFEIFQTTGTNDDENLKAHVAGYYPQSVVAVGGDGTVSLVARTLAGTDRVLGILPTGSGNGLSKDINIPQNDLKAALKLLVGGKIVKIDTLEANNYFFMHLADEGFNARIVRLYDNSDSRGLGTYMRFVLQEFFSYQSHFFEVTTDNGNFTGNAFMITIANSKKFGSNLTINPDGDWSDGRFEIVIIRSFPKKEGLRLFWQLLTKRIKFSHHSIVLKCKEAKVKCRGKRTLQYDGEVAGRFREINIKLNQKNLNIIVP